MHENEKEEKRDKWRRNNRKEEKNKWGLKRQ